MKTVRDWSYEEWFDSMVSDQLVTSPRTTTDEVEDQTRALEYWLRFLRSLDQDLGLSNDQLGAALEDLFEDGVYMLRDERVDVELRAQVIDAMSMMFDHVFAGICEHPDAGGELCSLCRRWWIAFPGVFEAPELGHALVRVLRRQLESASACVRSSGIEGIAEWFVRYPWADRGSRPVELEPLVPTLRTLIRMEPFEQLRDLAEWVWAELHQKFDFGSDDRSE